MYVGQAIRRREDERFLRGRGRYVEDIALDQPIAHAAFVRSPHGARRGDAHRQRPGRLDAGRARGADRRGLDPRRLWRGRGRLADQGQERRRGAHRQPAADLRRRDGALRRRDRRHGRRRGPPPGARRGRGRGCRLRGEAGQHHHRQGARSRHPPRAPGARHQRGAGHRARPQGGDRGGAGAGPSRHRGRGAQQPRHRRAHRAPLLPRPPRHGERPLHGVDHASGAAYRPPVLHQVAAHPRAQAPGDRARCRRRLRHEALPLSRGGAGAVGRPSSRAGRCAGWARAPNAWWGTPTPATTTPWAAWASTRTAGSSA